MVLAGKYCTQAHQASLFQRPDTLQDACWHALRSNITLGNVIELMDFLDGFIFPPRTSSFHDRCMKYIVQAYRLLRERRGVDALREKLPPDVFERLEAEAAAGNEARERGPCKAFVGRVVEPAPPACDSTCSEPSVSGLLPYSYTHAALRVGVLWPGDINPLQREAYLGATAFQAVFGMRHEQFQRLSLWRQRNLKKLHGLF